MLMQLPFVGFDIAILFIFLWIFVAILAIAAAVFWTMMLVDCAKKEFDDKLVWILIILFAGLLGATLYYLIIKKSETKNRKYTHS